MAKNLVENHQNVSFIRILVSSGPSTQGFLIESVPCPTQVGRGSSNIIARTINIPDSTAHVTFSSGKDCYM